MAKDTTQMSSFPTAIEIVVLFTITAMIAQTVSFHRGFTGFWTVIPVAVVSLLLAFFAFIRSRRLISSLLAIIAVLRTIPSISTVAEMFPLRQAVQAKEFQDPTVTDVLYHLAKSKSDFPVWRFHVSTQQIAYQRVSLTIPADARLGDTLNAIMQKIDGDYEWNWHKHCGNEPSPLCASFYISGNGPIERSDYALLIDRHEVFDILEFDHEDGRKKR